MADLEPERSHQLLKRHQAVVGLEILSDDRPHPGSEIPLAAFRQSILEGNSRIGAH